MDILGEKLPVNSENMLENTACSAILLFNSVQHLAAIIGNTMKFKIIMMLVILSILSVTPMIYMGKFDPMAFIDSGFKGGSSEFAKLKAKAPKNLTSVVTDKKVQVYKWRDKNGVMQFSNTPPTGVGSEAIELNPDHNIIQAVKVPVKEEKEAQATSAAMPNPYSVKGMKKVMEDAKGVEGLLQKRHEEQQKMMNNL